VVPVLGLLLTPALALAQEADTDAIPPSDAAVEGDASVGDANTAAQDPAGADAEVAEAPLPGETTEGRPGGLGVRDGRVRLPAAACARREHRLGRGGRAGVFR